MDAIEVLAKEYPGDAAWQRFVDVFRADWAKRVDKDKYIAALGDEELAIVLAASLGDQSISWLKTPIAALNQRSPAAVLREEPLGKKILRTLLMRMPR
jgi:hypothetical protein